MAGIKARSENPGTDGTISHWLKLADPPSHSLAHSPQMVLRTAYSNHLLGQIRIHEALAETARP